jgi:hypothetical protein
MKLRCPACGAEITLDEAAQAADLQALDKAASAFGPDWPLVREYIGCFKGKRDLKADKLVRLAREIWEMWGPGNFCVGGLWYVVGREEFRGALTATINQVAPPLTNHNYLKKVLVAAADKTSQRRERELRQREEGLRISGWKADLTADDLPDSETWRREYLRRLKNLRLAQRRGPEAIEAAQAELEAHLQSGGTDDSG